MDEVPQPTQHDEFPRQMPEMARSDSSSASSVGDASTPQIVAPVPVRPRLPSRKSSDPGDVRAMSPRRTSEDLENLGREARDELRRHAKALQESLVAIFNRIEAVKEEHDKLDSNNKFLQKYIGDLMSTSKITATSSSRGKK